MTTLNAQIEAFDQMRDMLEMDYLGKWVIFHDEILEGVHDSFQDAAEDAVRRFGRGPYLIRQVGATPKPLPASVLYRPVYV